jgi:hypothetical protein
MKNNIASDHDLTFRKIPDSVSFAFLGIFHEKAWATLGI